MLLLVPAANASAGDRHGGGGGGDDGARPTIYGHRGAAGYRPEHTLGSYSSARGWAPTTSSPTSCRPRTTCSSPATRTRSAARPTSPTTPSSPTARRPRSIDGVAVTGWFTEDFTLAELKTLRAKERIPDIRQRNTLYDGRFEVPTFQEVIDLAQALSRELHRQIGIYPETKHPTYFRSIGLPLEEPLVQTLRRATTSTTAARRCSCSRSRSPTCKALDRELEGAARAAARRAETRKPGDVVAPATRAPTATSRRPPGCADDRHATPTASARRRTTSSRATPTARSPAADDVRRRRPRGRPRRRHPYTFRNENTFLPVELRARTNPADYGNAIEEYRSFFATGVDGVFSDNPDTAKAARDDE